VPLSLTLVLIVAAVPGLSAGAAGEPAPVLDQSFTSPTNISVSVITVPLVYVAQTFTAGQSGILRSVSLDMVPSLEGDMRVDIRTVADGLPTGAVLATRPLSYDDLQAMRTGRLSYQVTFYDNLYITAGTQYAIVVNYTSYSGGSNPQALWFGANGNAYTRGSAFTALDAPTTAWAPAGAGYDLHFQTYVITGMPVSDLKIVRVSGPKKAHACQVFKETYRVTNLGPDKATNVSVSLGGGDQFSGVSVNGVPAGEPYYFELAAGQTKTIVAYFKVVAFVPGETRDAFISASASSDIYPEIAIDPNPDNNTAGTSIWLVGKPKLTCP
jgi:hypothetical protein